MIDTAESYRVSLTHHCYRMLGVLADAEDVVQETFVRASQANLQTDQPLKPWLWKVATRLSIDELRKRKVREYSGIWLPEPIDTPNPEEIAEQLENLTLGFLATLETLSEKERAVLVLRDASGLSSQACAECLDETDANVRKILTRARQKMAARRERTPTLRHDRDVVRGKILSLMGAIMAGNANAIVSMMSDDVVFETDTAGRYVAAHRRMQGADKVCTLFVSLLDKYGKPTSARFLSLNGWPALAYEVDAPSERFASRGILAFSPNAAGEIVSIRQYLAPEKVERFF